MDLTERVLDHSARITALEEWQKRQNGHLSNIDAKVNKLEGLMLDLFRQNNRILVSVVLALLGMLANLILLLVRG